MPIFRNNKAVPWRTGLPRSQPEQEALSASIDLEDIIQDYDVTSRRSIAASVTSLANNKLLSQSFFTATSNGKDDDTTSFYSALQDGFSLSEFEQTNLTTNPRGGGWFSDEADDLPERTKMLPRENFEVFWRDIIYQIEPKITLGCLWHFCERSVKTSINSVGNLLRFSTSDQYSLDSKSLNWRQPVTILKEISGSFKSGELTAIIGPSGAGKTSLLNFLSRRREDGYTGQLFVNNSQNRIRISTIPQHDHLAEYLTVRENLQFASRLKNPGRGYDHKTSIERVSRLLGLVECLDTKTKKISGGEQKRLAIAQELLSQPDILILDEPTSGLDSLTCHKTISVLRNLVKRSQDPIAIVLTIHQPQQEVFDLFDKVYVMATGGIAIYDGPPDRCTQFIENNSVIRMADQDYNPASLMIEIASGEYGSEPIAALENQVNIEIDAYRRKIFKLRDQSLEVGSKFNSGRKKKSPVSEEEYATPHSKRQKPSLYIDQRLAKGSSMNQGSFFSKTWTLTRRCWLSISRDPKQMIARVFFHVFFPFALAFVMGSQAGRPNACPKFRSEYALKELIDSDNLTSEAVQEEMLLTLQNIGVLFILIYTIACANMAATVLSFTLDMQSSLKEYYNGWYSMPSYLFARFISDFPMEICFPFVSLILAYPLTGQMSAYEWSDFYRLLITTIAIIIGSMIGQTLSMIIGAIYLGHVSTALFASQGASLPLIFFSGFVVRTKNMSKLAYSLSHLSYFRYTLEVAMIARYGFNVCKCDPKTISGQDAKLVGVTDKLRSFIDYYMDINTEQGGTETITNVTSLSITDSPKRDLFQLFAKQISLYNTHGIDVKSCQDVVPYQLSVLSLSDSDLPGSMMALVIMLVVIKLLLLLTVKLVVKFRTSL